MGAAIVLPETEKTFGILSLHLHLLLFPTAAHLSLLLTPTPSSTVDPLVPVLAHASPTSPMTLPGRPAIMLPPAQIVFAGKTVPSRILTLSFIMTMLPMVQLAPM